MDSSDNGSNDSDDDGAFSTLVTKREHVNESTVSSALAIKREKNIKFSASSTLAIKQERDSKSTAPLALAIKHEKNAECSAASTLAIKQEKDTESAAFSTLKIKHEKNAEFSAASTLPIKREEGTESTSSSVPTIKREPMEPIDRSDEYLEFIEKWVFDSFDLLCHLQHSTYHWVTKGACDAQPKFSYFFLKPFEV